MNKPIIYLLAAVVVGTGSYFTGKVSAECALGFLGGVLVGYLVMFTSTLAIMRIDRRNDVLR